jgi:hypothetical protein
LAIATAAFRLSPASFARFIGDLRHGEPSASSCENFTFHGQQLWEMYRYNRFEVELDTGRRTLGMPRDEHMRACPDDPSTERRRSADPRLTSIGVDFHRRAFKIHET